MIDFRTLEIDLQAETTKAEVQMRLNAFKVTDSYTGLQALAIKIRDIVLMEPNTQPNALGMGVGIRNFLFEHATTQVLDTLTSLTEEQLARYLPNNNLIRTIDYRYENDNENIGTIYLIVYVNKTAEEFEAGRFALSFTRTSTSDKSEIISEVYI